MKKHKKTVEYEICTNGDQCDASCQALHDGIDSQEDPCGECRILSFKETYLKSVCGYDAPYLRCEDCIKDFGK